MRLIDADALLTAFPVDDEPLVTKSCIRMTIQHMPTIETNVGEWIDMSNGGAIRRPWWESGKCDQCGRYGSKSWDYCPCCGSRNRKE